MRSPTTSGAASCVSIPLDADWRVADADGQWVVESRVMPRRGRLEPDTERWQPRAYCHTRTGLLSAVSRIMPGLDACSARLPENSETMSALAEAESFADIRRIRDVAVVIASGAKDNNLRAAGRKIRNRANRLIAQQVHQDRCAPSDSDFQQAKTGDGDASFLQIVAKPDAEAPQKKLTRVAFKVSRLMEFCSVRELQNQTGHSICDWPLVAGEELFDNALDAAEEVEVAPDITVIVNAETIIIQDNGGGIDAETIKSILDYTIRVSSREAYVSPTRGAQGNALKTILAMGYVLDRKIGSDANSAGVTIIETRGIKHQIEFRVDHINNQPKLVHLTAPSAITIGTRLTIKWPPCKLLEQAEDSFKRLIEAYVWFNPHLTLRGVWFGREFINVTGTNPNWDRWKPRNPTSPHWYDESRLTRYLAAHVARDRDLEQQRTVRSFIAEFRGLSGTTVQRKILAEVGCSHQSLAQFFGIEQVNRAGIDKLLAAMRRYSKPVAPKHLGVIGIEHFKQRFLAAGGNIDTFKYQCRKGMTSDGIPYIVEFAFGLHQSGLSQDRVGVSRKFVTGANWSAGISNPFRAFGSTGEGLESTLAKVRANATAPVICALHLASAYIQYADRGKSSIILTDDAEQPDD
jgi:DNA topoisomerase VI subunit B